MMAGRRDKNTTDRDDDVDMLVHVRDRGAQKITEQDHAPDPEESAADIIGQEAAILHAGDAGNRETQKSG